MPHNSFHNIISRSTRKKTNKTKKDDARIHLLKFVAYAECIPVPYTKETLTHLNVTLLPPASLIKKVQLPMIEGKKRESVRRLKGRTEAVGIPFGFIQ